MAKEASNDFRQVLQSSQGFIQKNAHAELVNWLLFCNALLDVLPYLLVGIELRRVRWQEDEFQFAVGGGDVILNNFGFVNRMTVYDQEYWLSCAEHQLPEEAAKDFGVAVPVVNHELQLAIGADGRQHLHRHALAGGTDHRRAASRTPSGAGVVVASHPCFVGEHDQCSPGLGARLESWELISVPTLHEASVLLVSAVQRALGREAQPLHHLAQRRQAQRHVELAFNKLADDAKRPQAELESKLIGGLIAHGIGDPLQLLSCDFGRSAGAFLGKQGILTTLGKRCDPFEDDPRGHGELLSHNARRNACPYHFDALHSLPLLLHAA